MAHLTVRNIYEDKEFKIKTHEKSPAFGIFVPLGKTFSGEFNILITIKKLKYRFVVCLREFKIVESK